MLGAAIGTHLHQELLRTTGMSCGTEGPQCLQMSETDAPAAAYPEECEDLKEDSYGLTRTVTQHHHLQEPVVSDGEPTPYSGSPPSSWAHRVPPCMPRLIVSSALAKLPPEITVTPPTPTLSCPQGTVSKETRLKLKGMAPLLRLTGEKSPEGCSQPSQEPLQQSDAAHRCEQDKETQMDV